MTLETGLATDARYVYLHTYRVNAVRHKAQRPGDALEAVLRRGNVANPLIALTPILEDAAATIGRQALGQSDAQTKS